MEVDSQMGNIHPEKCISCLSLSKCTDSPLRVNREDPYQNVGLNLCQVREGSWRAFGGNSSQILHSGGITGQRR